MELKDIQALVVGSSVGFKRSPDAPTIPAKVLQNGPRLDAAGKPIPYMHDLLVVQLGEGPMTMNWEPINYPDGIPELAILK